MDIPTAPASIPASVRSAIFRISASVASLIPRPTTQSRTFPNGTRYAIFGPSFCRDSRSRYSAEEFQSQSTSYCPSSPAIDFFHASRCSGTIGASDIPSWPMISVVTPCAVLFVMAGSKSATRSEWLWVSTNPGATAIPSASMIFSAAAPSRRPTAAIVPSFIPISRISPSLPSPV